MGFSGKTAQSESGLEWVIAGIPLRAPLKAIYTNPAAEKSSEIDECSTTPTNSEARIPARLVAPPPAPRKRKATLKCNYSSREFFTPPDLDTVFTRHIERAN